MHAEELNASLKKVNVLKAAQDEHVIVAITNPQEKITCVRNYDYGQRSSKRQNK